MEILITLMLLTEQLEKINPKHDLKRRTNNFKNHYIKQLEVNYDKMYQQDEEIVLNVQKKREELVKMVASMQESDLVMFTEFTRKYLDNIELARTKGVSFFNKII